MAFADKPKKKHEFIFSVPSWNHGPYSFADGFKLKQQKIMLTQDYRIMGLSNLMQVPSQKAEGGFILKRFIRLQEFGGWSGNDTAGRLSDAIIATLMGQLAQCDLHQGQLVRCALRFSIREYQGNWYQDINVTDIHKF